MTREEGTPAVRVGGVETTQIEDRLQPLLIRSMRHVYQQSPHLPGRVTLAVALRSIPGRLLRGQGRSHRTSPTPIRTSWIRVGSMLPDRPLHPSSVGIAVIWKSLSSLHYTGSLVATRLCQTCSLACFGKALPILTAKEALDSWVPTWLPSCPLSTPGSLRNGE